MRKLFVIIVMAIAIAITCTESPFDPASNRPVPDYVGQGSCNYITEPVLPASPGYVGEISFYIQLDGFTDTEPPKHKLCLVQRTVEALPCINYTIVEEVEVGKGMIEITHLGIDNPLVCLTALGPAVAAEGFELPIGTYTLRFKHGSAVDEYELIADGSTVTVSTPHEGSYTIYVPPIHTMQD